MKRLSETNEAAPSKARMNAATDGGARGQGDVRPFSPALAAAVMSLLAAVSMQGCGVTPMTEEACLDLDWAEMGAERGLRGQEPASLYRYEQACAEHGLAPDSDAYARAHRRGLDAYCTLENGYAGGRGGGRDARGCASAPRSGYGYGYDLGLAVRDVLDRSETRNRLMSGRTEVRRLNREISQKEMSSGMDLLQSDEERERKRGEIQALRDRRDGLLDEIEESYDALSEAIRRYEGLASNPIRHSPEFPFRSELMRVELEIQRLKVDMPMERQMLRFPL